MSKIIFHPERCAACGACSIACIDQNDIDTSKGYEPLIKASISESVSEETGKICYHYDFYMCGRSDNPGTCGGCNERVRNGLMPACVTICPFDALELQPEN